jgi:hypothetical protein
MGLPNSASSLAQRAVCGLFCLAAMTFAPSAGAQQRAYCHITSIESQRLVNAVQVTIRADGLMRTDIQSSDLFNTDAARMGAWEKMGKRVLEIPIRVLNARSKVGSITNVGIYPVSHVEVTVPPESLEGIGVNVRIFLYQPAITREVRTSNDRWNFGAPGEKGPFISIEQSQDRRSIVVIVTSDRRTPTAEKRRVPADPERRILEVSASDGNVAVHAVDADLRELARELGRVAQVPIATAATLERTVSMCLDSVTLDQALDAIAMTYGLSLERIAGAYYIADGDVRDLSAYHGSDFAEIPIRNLSAMTVRNCLPDVMLGYVHADAGRNALTVAGPRELVEKVRSDVAKLDAPVPMVEVSATAVEFEDTADLSALINGRIAWPGGTLDLTAGGGDIAYSSLGTGPSDLEASLHGLLRTGRARLRSQTRSVVMNGGTATLFVGREQRLATQYYDFWSQTFEARILTLRFGTSLRVTPWTAGRGFITATVRAEVSNVTDTEPVTGNPTVAQRMAETTVRLADGETLYVGGLDVAQDTGMRRSALMGGLLYPQARGRSGSRLGVFVTARTVVGSAVGRDAGSEQG